MHPHLLLRRKYAGLLMCLTPAMCSCGGAVQSWIAMMAAYVKGLDPNHLLSIGSEGFYSPSDTAQADADPQGANS